MVLYIRFFYKNASSCCFSTFFAVEWRCKRVQHFGSTTFGALDTIFEAERWWSYNKSTTVSAEMKIKKERLRNGVTLLNPLKLLLPEVPLQQSLEGLAMSGFVAGHLWGYAPQWHARCRGW